MHLFLIKSFFQHIRDVNKQYAYGVKRYVGYSAIKKRSFNRGWRKKLNCRFVYLMSGIGAVERRNNEVILPHHSTVNMLGCKLLYYAFQKNDAIIFSEQFQVLSHIVPMCMGNHVLHTASIAWLKFKINNINYFHIKTQKNDRKCNI